MHAHAQHDVAKRSINRQQWHPSPILPFRAYPLRTAAYVLAAALNAPLHKLGQPRDHTLYAANVDAAAAAIANTQCCPLANYTITLLFALLLLAAAPAK
eukprot:4769-Heterococcus_DN1.PRE.2